MKINNLADRQGANVKKKSEGKPKIKIEKHENKQEKNKKSR